MPYLFISFYKNLDTEQNNNMSLNEQFKLLQRRMPLERQSSSLKEFMEICFPSGFRKKYYIACPNFKREKESGKYGFWYLNNVVIRPEHTPKMASVLPDNQNIILIGDIRGGDNLKEFQVREIQFIDINMSSPRDMVIQESACLSFEKNVWSIRHVDYNDTFFTPNNVDMLISESFTVDNPEEVLKTYEEWEKYFNFREYYLDEQAKRNFKLDSAEYVMAYAINRQQYRRNQSLYDDYILDGAKAFTQTQMVLLSEKIENADEFPLIRLNIDRNRKEFLAARVEKRGRMVSEEELQIHSLARDNVFISEFVPKDNKEFSRAFNQGYALGERFRVVSFDIEPTEEIQSLRIQFNKDVDNAFDNIDIKYDRLIEKELKQELEKYKKSLEKENDQEYKLKKEELDNNLDFVVSENKDKEILKEIDKIKSSIKETVTKKLKQDKDIKKEDFDKVIKEQINDEFNKIDIKSFYIEKNKKTLINYKEKLEKEALQKEKQFSTNKERELKSFYANDIRKEKHDAQTNLKEKLENDIKDTIENKTIRRFSLYFRLGSIDDNISRKELETISKCKYIIYDKRAEDAKIKRQKRALDNFYSGEVKNPYLSTYLFNPQTLPEINIKDFKDWTWFLENLNDKQKEAVKKALSSNSIFLLQGPPGTGKTQVITEIVAQYAKLGRKVLISSETHKAIDNVFERLPKVAEIVPIRLIPSYSKKNQDNEYDPEFLVDNFYKNISSNMKKHVERYKNFKNLKEDFSTQYKELELMRTSINRSQKVLDKANKEIAKYDLESKKINDNINKINDEKDSLRMRLDELRRTKRAIINDNIRLENADLVLRFVNEYIKEIESIVTEDIFNNADINNLLKEINSIDLSVVKRELMIIDPESSQTILKVRQDEIRQKITSYQNELGEDLPEKASELKKLRVEFTDIKNKLNKTNHEEMKDLELIKIFKFPYIVDNINEVEDKLVLTKNNIIEIKTKYIDSIGSEELTLETDISKLDEEISVLKKQVNDISNKIYEIQDQEDVKEIQNKTIELQRRVNNFFNDFEIYQPYHDLDEALEIIKNKWNELEHDFESRKKENKQRIPIYEKISNYLSSEEVIEQDRIEYTKDLFENANVFGLTATSNDRFTGNNIDSLGKYNLGRFDLKTVGIDVVIIDEVSKSSFVDLLIPILYGKIVILVGDHRQLPPMYEFAKLREDDFKGLNEEIINKDINDKFTELYEECFFKTLFENMPDSYKTMLVQQYRSHEHIMNVFNVFYNKELKLGHSGQNNMKQHNIKLISNGRNVIFPERHIYFVDCKETENRESDSTSIYNNGEINVVVNLVDKLNKYFKQNPVPKKDKLSIGIITTYGDQARRIRQQLKNQKVKTDGFKTDEEKMIVSTVDDFQGDERDIIILSMVRNPENPERSNPGFILAYQRINVALSRARKLLIIVGNRKYLENKGVIDLPDVHGRRGMERKNYRVYEDIISVVERYGKVIEDTDIIEERKARIDG